MSKLNPFFSVVIPLHNKANFIEACVESVLQQDFKNFELIIVDDGSTDDSIEKINNFKDNRVVLEQQQNKGAAYARNRGVEIATSHWIAFLDADDFWKENHLSEFYKAVQLFPDEVVFSSKPSIIKEHNKTTTAQYSFELDSKMKPLSYFENSTKHSLLITSGMLIKKDFFKQIGGFNEAIYSGQDTDLFIRIGLQKKIVFNPKSTFTYYVSSENNISKTPRFKERLTFINAYQHQAEKNPALQKYLDLNRFSIVLRAKMHGDSTWKVAQQELNENSLSKKQLFLLKLPGGLLKVLKSIQQKLLQFGVEKSAF
ncbi:glycosyltransferase family 2 protein [Psychroflexus planctonicus]|uniref:Glycosyl transferase n=1 Tax=Psychroflexus planctonicus TaxID=1526575 RepID=A0ABQ1SGX3_9FLAO|nr:glycosyltransferase family A protein [Psychroflexus planctonicus]GGE33355.1 glycosyl transferase [Psychroflexus planctonicus]